MLLVQSLTFRAGPPKLVKSQQLTQRAIDTDSRWKYHVLLSIVWPLVLVITDPGFIISFRAYLGWHLVFSPYTASWLCLSRASQSWLSGVVPFLCSACTTLCVRSFWSWLKVHIVAVNLLYFSINMLRSSRFSDASNFTFLRWNIVCKMLLGWFGKETSRIKKKTQNKMETTLGASQTSTTAKPCCLWLITLWLRASSYQCIRRLSRSTASRKVMQCIFFCFFWNFVHLLSFPAVIAYLLPKLKLMFSDLPIELVGKFVQIKCIR